MDLHPLDFQAARQSLNCIIVCTLLSVAVSNLIQHNGAEFLPLNDEHPRVHFCTPLITMPYAPLRSMVFGFIAACAYIAFSL